MHSGLQRCANFLGSYHVRLAQPARKLTVAPSNLHPLLIDPPQEMALHAEEAAGVAPVRQTPHTGSNPCAGPLETGCVGDSERGLLDMDRTLDLNDLSDPL